MIYQKRLDEIKERCAAASPGPWFVVQGDPVDAAVIARGDPTVPCGKFGRAEHAVCEHEVLGTSEWVRGEADDLALMAHARTDIPDLLAEVERLRGWIKHMHLTDCVGKVDECSCALVFAGRKVPVSR